MQIHFIGIGGTGMNGVAQLAAHAGYSVTGSDRATGLEIFQCLEKLGITIVPQDGSGITPSTDAVVFSTAIEADNPDLVRARELNIPLLHRAEMLAKLCEGKEVIAIAGTAGKSTVTGLLGHIFQTLEKDPTVYCGASVLNFVGQGCRSLQSLPHDNGASLPLVESRYSESLCNTRSLRDSTNGREASLLRSNDQREWQPCPTTGNVRFGADDGPWIIEADESDKSFLHFHPNHAIITNIAEDHFELSELKQLFALFESQVSGTVIKQPEVFQGLEENVPMLGKHNLENAANALTLCKALGLDMNACIAAVHTFKGMERRLQRHGDRVIDDFAHSPIKIAAALEAVSEVWPAFNVVWRPHGFTPLFQGLENFIEVFSKHWTCRGDLRRRHSLGVASKKCDAQAMTPAKDASTLFILPVYYAGGTVEKKITSEQFVERLQAAGVPAEYAESFQGLEKKLLENGQPVLVMGARDPELPRFAKQIATELDQILPTNHMNLLE